MVRKDNMKTERRKQLDYLQRLREEKLPCSCGEVFCEADMRTPENVVGGVVNCPGCGKELSAQIELLTGIRFWGATR